jgi:hypothetical protein
MIINQNSWHYKVVKSFRSDWEIPDNLCSYVRSLFFRLIGIVFIAACVVSSVAVWFLPEVNETSSFLVRIVHVLGSITVTLVVVALAIFSITGIAWLWYEYVRPKFSKYFSNKKPGVFIQYIKDKHGKICRNLEFKSRD